MKNIFRLAILFLSSIAVSNPVFAESFAPYGSKTYLELIAEGDETSTLGGFHVVAYNRAEQGNYAVFFGGGLVNVSLPLQNDSFVALHAVAGTDFMLSSWLGLTAEFGIDIGEQMISNEDDKGNVSVGGFENNQVDFNFALGTVLHLDKNAYIKVYVRHHFFDGVYLPDTNVTFAGVRAGFSF